MANLKIFYVFFFKFFYTTDETDEANALNDFFGDQTILDDQHAPILNIEPYTVALCLH